MFTGLIQEVGTVQAITVGTDATEFVIRGPNVLIDAQIGDSIAVNGVCLTVVAIDGEGNRECEGNREGEAFRVFVMAESLRRSALGQLEVGDQVNLEAAMPANGRFGGHIVQGHVDGVGVIAARDEGDRWETFTITLPDALQKYVVEKGSIAVDGVSLTVAAITDGRIQIGLIPATLAATTLGVRQPGEAVNIEVDVLAKYVESLLGGRI